MSKTRASFLAHVVALIACTAPSSAFVSHPRARIADTVTLTAPVDLAQVRLLDGRIDAMVCAQAQTQTPRRDIVVPGSKREVIERRTVDAVIVNDAGSEASHAYAGDRAADGYFEGRRFRTTTAGGWISYELMSSDKPLKIVCTWGGAGDKRPAFDVIVDGQKVASESLTDHPIGTRDTEYLLSPALTSNKRTVTVRFQAQPNATVGALLDVRTVWADLQE